MSLYTLNKIKYCECCNNKIEKFHINIGKIPVNTVNKDIKSFKSKNFKPLIINFCHVCKNISLKKEYNFDNFYKNFVNDQKQSNDLNSYIKKNVKKSKLKPNILNIGKLNFILNNSLKKKINFLNFDPRIKKLKDLNLLLSNNKNKMDAIYIENFFANLQNINDVTKQLSGSLNDTGEIIINSHYGLNIISNYNLGMIYHEHYNYFSIKSLINLFRRYNLYCHNLKIEDGSFKIVFSKKPKYINKRLRDIISIENEYTFKDIEKFKKKIIKIKSDLRTQLSKNKNYKIVAYGASIGSTTKIVYYNLYKYLNFVLDDFPIAEKIFLPKKEFIVEKSSKFKFEKNKKYIFLILIPKHLKKILPFIKKKSKYIKNCITLS